MNVEFVEYGSVGVPGIDCAEEIYEDPFGPQGIETSEEHVRRNLLGNATEAFTVNVRE